MRRLLPALALLLAISALAGAPAPVRVSFVLPLDQSGFGERTLVVYCPEIKGEVAWFPAASVDPQTGGWCWVWETRGVPPGLMGKQFIAYASDGAGHIAVVDCIPAKDRRVTVAFGEIPAPSVEEHGVWFPAPTGVPADAIDRMEIVVDGGKVLVPVTAGKVPDLGALRLGERLSLRIVLKGGLHYIQGPTITIESGAAPNA